METQVQRFMQNEFIIYSIGLRIAPFNKGGVIPNVLNLDYNTILEESLEEGFIKSEDDIKCLVYGLNFSKPFFSSMSAEEEYSIFLNIPFTSF